MDASFRTARQLLLEPAELSLEGLERTLGVLMARRVELGEIFLQRSASESWVLENGIVRDGSFNIDQGVGIRAVVGEQTGFAYTDELTAASIEQAALAARSIVRSGRDTPFDPRIDASAQPQLADLYPPASPIDSLDVEAKLTLLREVDRATRAFDNRVREVTASLVGVHDVVLVIASDGTLAADVRPLCRFSVSVIAEQDGRRERGSAGRGGRGSYGAFFPLDEAVATGVEAARQAVLNLDAVPVAAGPMMVVLGAGWPGVLLHEAVGHGLEGDFNRKGSSNFAGRIGERVASPLCTIVDDGSIEGRRGSLRCDDEGTPTRENVLIEHGVLRGYLQDKQNARLMGVPPTGNGRRQSYAHTPLPRMTNTFMQAGAHEPGEIIESVRDGIYAVNFGGGQVDITSGQFVFNMTEAYRIRDGRVAEPVRGATLVGDGPAVMQQVSMVGQDVRLDPGVGVCGKDGQSLPVSVGQPTLRVDRVTVGGTS